ncbi:flagellar basal body rod protein FlgB [Bosea sp. PAMC 26642]|uniref:flagellar basal body rod protein FlgB n=1 Tax=Bosea sp. (strain PAMC 26642) TaxID=1792307 RepID=UPI0007700E51|nr:flagellar basal body rod protein FlgB [Bosea sp. PAMC 26642]AMJ62665.1 flagellar biosynthesis protein FlgB [Bosea sp. PAMC 26642]
MEPIHLFDLAAKQANWLAVRQNAVSQNVANANTPRYTAVDVEPFEAIVRKTTLAVAATSPDHITSTPAETMTARQRKSDSWSTVHSGNSVSIEQEMLKAGDISRSYSLTTNIVKSFHRMMAMAIKS